MNRRRGTSHPIYHVHLFSSLFKHYPSSATSRSTHHIQSWSICNIQLLQFLLYLSLAQVGILNLPVSQYIQKILWGSFTNFQKRVRASDFSGTIALYQSTDCNGEVTSSSDYDPQSNPAFCIGPGGNANGQVFSSVDVDPTEPARYFIEFYGNADCTNLVSTSSWAGEACFTPTNAKSMFLSY